MSTQKTTSNFQFTAAESRAIEWLRGKMTQPALGKPSKVGILRAGLRMLWESFNPGMAYPQEGGTIVPQAVEDQAANSYQ